MREIETPREQLLERPRRRCRDPGRPEGADHRHPDGAGVEAPRVRTDHVPVDAAVAALVDRAVAIDEEVVADVTPAVRLDVVGLNAAHDRCRLRGRVVVGAGRVVDDREPDARCIGGAAPTDRLVGTPCRSRHDRRGAGDGCRAERDHLLRAAYQRGSEIGDPTHDPRSDRGRGPHPGRVPEAPSRGGAVLTRAEVGSIVTLDDPVHPAAPRAVGRANLEPDRAGSPPAKADEIERSCLDESGVVRRRRGAA